MSKKSRRHARHLPRSKRRKGRARFSTPVAQPSAVAQKYEPAPRAEAAVLVARGLTPKAMVTQHPTVAVELRRIGIMAGIIAVILVVLAFVLP